MKKMFNFLKDLYIDSNRWLHFIVGGIIMVFMCGITALFYPYNPNVFQVITVGTFSALIAMCTAEFKDKAKGGIFDWKDIVAGVTPALIMDILCLILLMFK